MAGDENLMTGIGSACVFPPKSCPTVLRRGERGYLVGKPLSLPTNDGIGRMIRRLCLAFGVSMAFVAPAFAELAMTGTATTMRAGPTSKADVVQRIPRRAEIDLEKCARDWCRASWRGRFGYIPAEAVVLGPPAATLPGDEMPPPILYASPTYIAPPAWKWTGPYIGLNGGIGSSSW